MSTSDFSQLNTLAQEYGMLLPGSTVLCAVSGGADSIYLLHRLTLLRGLLDFRLVAAHYDHQLRPSSGEDAAFVARFVEQWCGKEVYDHGKELPPVPLIVGRGDVRAAAQAKRPESKRPPGKCATPFCRRPPSAWEPTSSPPPTPPTITPKPCCST